MFGVSLYFSVYFGFFFILLSAYGESHYIGQGMDAFLYFCGLLIAIAGIAFPVRKFWKWLKSAH